MHNLMSEEDIHNSPSCWYCGCNVGEKKWKQVWEGHAEYFETDCADCGKNIHFKLKHPKNEKGDEQDTDSIDARIKILEYENQER